MKKIYFFILLLFFSTNVFANSIPKGCPEVIIDLKELYKTNKNLQTEATFEVFNYGFFLMEKYDFKKKEIIFKKKNGYPLISTFLDLELFNKKIIESGYLITKINNQDISTLNDEELKKIFYSVDDPKKEEITDIEFLNLLSNKTVNLKLKKNKYSYYLTEPRFQINSINDIDTVKGNFEVNYNFSYDSLHPDLGKEISKYNLFKNSQCPISLEDVGALSLGQTEFLFLNRAIINNDEVSSYNYLALENRSEEKLKNNNAIIISVEDGVGKFRSNFDFRKFPLDEQTLKISIMEMYGLLPKPESSLQLLTTPIQFQVLKDYYENNILKEWKITNYDINLKTANLLGYDIPSAQMDIILKVKRNVLYYIIKIILPIFLILSLAWYVFWIHPKELESRVTTSIVCFLALVAYNFVIDSEIPKLGYLTFMDWIILLSYIFCALPTAISITLNRHIKSKKYDVIEMNNYIKYLGPILYLSLLIIGGFFTTS